MTSIPIQYNYSIVALSILIAIFASYTTIELVSIARNAVKTKKSKWLFAGAGTMGIGIWAMHFTGMIASGIGDMDLQLNVIATVISLIVAVIGSLIAFRFIIHNKVRISSLLLAGIIMGLSIASMHYIGMYAVEYNLYMDHHLSIFLLSILMAIIGSLIALTIFSRVSHKNLYIYQLPIALILGMTISSMHYVAMASYTLYNKPHLHTSIFYDLTFSIDSNLMINSLIVSYAIIFTITYTITLRNKRIQYQMYEMAFHDPLTALPNRYLLDHHFHKTLQKSKEKTETFAVLFLDLDNFKHVNDSYGHEIGDLFLQQIAETLTLILEERAIICRHGGDEFVVLAKKTDKQTALQLAEEIREEFQLPIRIDGHNIASSFSIGGVSLYPDDGLDMETLIRAADQAMYAAKNNGKNNFHMANS
ncbi:diguanylate cyclase/phosphodiesterase [Gracilibacillus boraciitolerans JCM 21714]|uniref:Diguanylate cyclase/phosphodiesterase n=1 Tax=Gracilibacillus boraciitolerans JCM 21714 TaxID=1298598 RepID=W4VJC2_9BACI|nr:diguanylate cyclase [Gracilibacillus boraciitolerans]GAE93317.1 diguanylate cyclase/phosphodiesterase [Gracilibacillus boraciitolerans JCM 21714]